MKRNDAPLEGLLDVLAEEIDNGTHSREAILALPSFQMLIGHMGYPEQTALQLADNLIFWRYAAIPRTALADFCAHNPGRRTKALR